MKPQQYGVSAQTVRGRCGPQVAAIVLPTSVPAYDADTGVFMGDALMAGDVYLYPVNADHELTNVKCENGQLISIHLRRR